MTKVFLKFNNTDSMSITCLTFWLEIFKENELYLMCDKDVSLISHLIKYYNITVFKTDYSLTIPYNHLFKKEKNINCAAVNFTIFELAKNDLLYWMIDADDTMFLTHDATSLKEKLNHVETIFTKDNLDGFSLDFYREHNDHWSFGVGIFKGNIDYNKIIEVDFSQYKKKPKNLDGCFDILRHEQKLKLESFVIDNTMFIHTKSFKIPYAPNGIYYWNNKKVWNTALNVGVIIL